MGRSFPARLLTDAVGFVAASAAILGILHLATRRAEPLVPRPPDPRYATPRATLESYIQAVLAVDEGRELATATPELRARAERQRGTMTPVQRYESLKGKAALFRGMPIRFVREKIWGETAKILVNQGSPAGISDPWVYSFHRIGGEWKISGMERTEDMRW
jgi:hypothetical protein